MPKHDTAAKDILDNALTLDHVHSKRKCDYLSEYCELYDSMI